MILSLLLQTPPAANVAVAVACKYSLTINAKPAGGLAIGTPKRKKFRVCTTEILFTTRTRRARDLGNRLFGVQNLNEDQTNVVEEEAEEERKYDPPHTRIQI